MSAGTTGQDTLITNLQGRLKNTSLPLTHGLLPLFEVVVNSIQAIEERGNEDGSIKVEILRQCEQLELGMDESKRGPKPTEDILGFKVTDNGVGFNERNMKSFQTLDTDYKVSKGCRGIGRLLWLKAFNRVTIDSCFMNEEKKMTRRLIDFSPSTGIVPGVPIEMPEHSEILTIVQLDGFVTKYRTRAAKTCSAISEQMLEHCLWLFARKGSCPEIEVVDGTQTIRLSKLYEDYMFTDASFETVEVKGKPFELLHLRLRSNTMSAHTVAFCANNRLVREEKLTGKVPGLYGKIVDDTGGFFYSCYVSSVVLDTCALPERTNFISNDDDQQLFEIEDVEIDVTDVMDVVIPKIREQLAVHLAGNLDKAKKRVDKFVTTRGVRYRPILSRISDDQLDIDPGIGDKELELALHKHLAALESELLAEGHDIKAKMLGEDLEEYRERLEKYLEKAHDIKKSDLASYVSHRRVILDMFEIAIQRKADGTYVKEDLIHNLIMPMRSDSDEVLSDGCNLWLVDERLAFHEYLASDKPLKSMPITGSQDGKEPDICVLNVFDQPLMVSEGTRLPPASIEIIEIKRPVRGDVSAGEKDDPVEQAIGYLSRIRKGGVFTAKGRLIPQSESVPGFCYVLADLTPQMRTRCEIHHDLRLTADGLGYFGYKKNANAYVEVISFDRLLNAAKERNKAFFDQLGLPTT